VDDLRDIALFFLKYASLGNYTNPNFFIIIGREQRYLKKGNDVPISLKALSTDKRGLQK
jgi:hypothetical protein